MCVFGEQVYSLYNVWWIHTERKSLVKPALEGEHYKLLIRSRIYFCSGKYIAKINQIYAKFYQITTME